MHFGGAFHDIFNLAARQIQWHRGQAAQFGLGVFVDHLGQRQDEQARRVFTDQAIPTRQLNVADEGAVGQYQVLIQVQSTIRPARSAWCTDHQPQHAMAPAAHPVLVGLRQQIVDGVDPLRIDLPQGCFGEVVTGIQEGEGFAASTLGIGGPAEVLFVVAVQRRAATGIARVKEEILHVDRDELLGAAGLVNVRTAGDLAVVLFAFATTADVLLPSGEVEQAWVIAEGKTAIGLTAAFVRDTDQPRAVLVPGAALNQLAFRLRPQA